MKKLIPNLVVLFIVVPGFIPGCTGKMSEPMNPFFEEYSTPFGVPPFDRITNSHYIPAFREGIRRQQREIEEITADTAVPTFENTIAAFDRSGKMLRRVEGVFYRLQSAETSDELDSIAELLVPITSAHNSNILLNSQLFKRIDQVYMNRATLKLDQEQSRVLEKIHRRFVNGGAKLDEIGKERIREIDERLALLSLRFGNNVLAETNRFKLVIEHPEDLEGLPEAVRSAAAEAASGAGLEGKWVFTLNKPSWIPFLQYSPRRDLREKLYRAMFMRGDHDNELDNRPVISEILALRLERARMLGYEDHASFVLSEKMAGTPEKVYEFLRKVWDPALDKAREEARKMNDMINREGGGFDLKPWDWWYYAEKVRQSDYDLEEEEVRPYFSLESVKKGLFDVVNRLYGITMEKRKDLPVYQEEVEVYEMKESDGSHLGIIYMDFHPRPGKRAGAWSTSIRKEHVVNGQKIAPVHLIVMNFTRPTGDTPALLSIDETRTLFHEFGHALHSMFSECRYLTSSGTAVASDFVELPSQIMENWAAHPEVMKGYAMHYATGEPIPDELVRKMTESEKFNQGFATVEYLAASFLDMDYHTLHDPTGIDIDLFETRSMEKIGLIPEIIPRYRSTYFQHIFSGGYSAGYYSYIWAEMLDKDAFNEFLENGLFDRETADRFREKILTKGGSREEMQMFMDFRKKKPDIEPLLKSRGLLD